MTKTTNVAVRRPLSAGSRRVLVAQGLRASRTAAATPTDSARYITRPFGTALGGLVASAAIGAPFLIAGSIKSAYGLTLWRWFRTVPLPEDSGR